MLVPKFGALKGERAFANAADAKWLQEFSVRAANLINGQQSDARNLGTLLSELKEHDYGIIIDALYSLQTMLRAKMTKVGLSASPTLREFKEFIQDINNDNISNYFTDDIMNDAAAAEISGFFGDERVKNYCQAFNSKIQNNETVYDLNSQARQKFGDYSIEEVTIREEDRERYQQEFKAALAEQNKKLNSKNSGCSHHHHH